MKILVVDTETSGLPGQGAEGKPKAELIEMAAALIDTDIPDGLLWAECFLRKPAGGNAAVDINHIEDRMLDVGESLLDGRDPARDSLASWSQVTAAATHAEAIVAHDRDGHFDRGFISSCVPEVGTCLPWVNSRDLVFPRGNGGRLNYIAVDHDINPSGRWRHRALWDVLLLVDVLYHVVDLEAQVRQLMKPQSAFKVVFPSGFDADLNNLAKAAGFWFDRPRKWWIRNLPHDTQTEPTEARPFRIVSIGPPEKRSQ